MLFRRVGVLVVCLMALPVAAMDSNTVQGPFILDKGVVQPELNGICLQYKNNPRDTDVRSDPEVGLVGYGVEAYRSLHGEVKVLDRTTTAMLWSAKISSGIRNLSFVETRDYRTGENIILLRVGGDCHEARYFEIRTGHEKYLRRDKQGLVAVDEKKQELRGQPLYTIMSLSGRDSHIKDRMCLRICALDEWRAIWRNHSNTTEEPPEIDFPEEVVIAVFLGETRNCKGLALQQIIETEDTVEIFVRTDVFQSSKGNGLRGYPFGFYVLPKTEKTLFVKRDNQDFVSGTPRWTVLEKFEP